MTPDRFLALSKAADRRFWDKVLTAGTGCWPWQAATDGRGYGKFKLAPYESVRAHRVAYALVKGAISDGLDVLHSCDSPICCNPEHLSLGTHDDNMADMARKGRAQGGGRAGEANPRAKLTQANVTEIRALISAGHRNTDIARRYGVGDDIISKIRTGKAWVTDTPGAAAIYSTGLER